MVCYAPISAYQNNATNENGKRPLLFNPAPNTTPLEIPCGQCIGCRLERSRQWAVRMEHEAQQYGVENCFVTLTYSDEYLDTLDNPHTLHFKHFQDFMKRLRKSHRGVYAVDVPYTDSHGITKTKIGYPIRFYHCGEYGEKYKRPHYHACLFNFDFPDKILDSVNELGHRYYQSKILNGLWGHGNTLLSAFSWDTAAYCARYVTKKLNGQLAKQKYYAIDSDTGEYFDLAPEYSTMSRRPGIGANWFAKYKKQVYPRDYVVSNGQKQLPPKYYDRLLDKIASIELETIKQNRLENMSTEKHYQNNLCPRLRARHEVRKAALKRLKRS